LNLEVFNRNEIVSVDEATHDFVYGVFPLPRHTKAQSSNFTNGFAAVAAVFLPTAYAALFTAQAFLS